MNEAFSGPSRSQQLILETDVWVPGSALTGSVSLPASPLRSLVRDAKETLSALGLWVRSNEHAVLSRSTESTLCPARLPSPSLFSEQTRRILSMGSTASGWPTNQTESLPEGTLDLV